MTAVSERYYEVAADRTVLQPPINQGARDVLLRDGSRVSEIREAIPSRNLYAALVDDTVCGVDEGVSNPDYYDGRTDTAFVGNLGDDAARVQETRVCEKIPIDALLDEKTLAATQHAEFVAVQSVRSTSSSNFWIDVGPASRRLLTSAGSFLQDRLKDRTIGTLSTNPGTIVDPTTYWPRNIPILLIRNSNGQRLLADVDEPAWGQVLKDVGLYDLAISDALVRCLNDIDAKHAADDWLGLAQIDVTDAAYGWPQYFTGEQSVSIREV